jgi:hypothetical protein
MQMKPKILTSALVALPLLLTVACGGEDAPATSMVAGGPYVVGFNVQTPQQSSVGYLTLQPSLTGALDTSKAIELSGSPSMVAFGNAVFVGDTEKFTYTRYDRKDGAFVKGDSINFSNEGMTFLYRSEFVSDTQAFIISDKAYELIEWNPTTMRITKRHSVAALRRQDFGLEWRNAETMYRKSDGVMLIYIAYHNDRKTFANAFHVALFDTRTGQIEALEDNRCGPTAGFGGWMDENEDAYLFSDNFGALGEILGGVSRPSCLLRLKKGERRIDPDYLIDLNAALGGKQAWGLFSAGGGKVYTAGLDMNRKGEFDTAYNFLFGPIHKFYRIDLATKTSAEVTAMAPAGVGWNPFRVEGKLYVPRTNGTFTKVGDWETSLTDVYVMDPETNGATKAFSLPGTIEVLARMP